MQQLDTKQKGRTTASRIAFAEPESDEWDRAWAGMAGLTGDVDLEAYEPMSGEIWAYIGSVQRDGAWCHEFRHRWHPRLKQRWLVRVPATKGWFPGSERLH